MAEVFSNSGYSTGLFGKWHLGDNYPYRPQDRGFSEVVSHGGGGIGQVPDYWNNSYVDDTYFHNGKPTQYKGYCTDVFFDEAKRFMKDQAELGEPFFTYISTNAPHLPFVCPEKYWKPYTQAPHSLATDVAIFYGMIANIDENVGKLRRWLTEEGLDENTVFIYMTDNGTKLGHKLFNAGMKGKKGSRYDGGHRVPFFLKLPAVSQGRDVAQLSAHVDVMPTLIDLCQLEPVDSDYGLDGISLMPWVNQADAPQDLDRVIITDSQQVIDPIKWTSTSIMTKGWRLVANRAKRELFDMSIDPSQKTNVASQFPERVKTLEEAYERWWEGLTPGFSRNSRIPVGLPFIDTVYLTSHDTRLGPTVKASMETYPAWNHSLVRQGILNEGVWLINVKTAGDYEIGIGRWPKESGLRMKESVVQGKATPGLGSYAEVPGKALDISKVTIQVAGVQETCEVDDLTRFATFKVSLPAGDVSLSSNFIYDDGSESGVAYAYFRKL